MTPPTIIYLIGFMGSGKSTIGRLIAANIGYRWIDTDTLIVAQCGMSIKDIFEKKGSDYFRKVERGILKKISKEKGIVVSTGGGLPCFEDNMDVILRSGISIFLQLSIKKILTRIGDDDQRPLLKNQSVIAIHQLYSERLLFYTKADMTMKADASPEAIVRRIQKKLNFTS